MELKMDLRRSKTVSIEPFPTNGPMFLQRRRSTEGVRVFVPSSCLRHVMLTGKSPETLEVPPRVARAVRCGTPTCTGRFV